jgi:DNA-binding FadR family transcriptional regulator
VFRRKNRHEQVVEELGKRIVRGEIGLAGGLPIEADLAAELGISRNALREAIKVLASKGLVEVRPKIGTRICPQEQWNLLDRDVLDWLSATVTGPRHARDLVEFRLIIEPHAAYLAALRATATDVAAIREAYLALEACIGHPMKVPAADIVFHRSIYTASHNAVLNQMGSLITPLMQIQITMTTASPGSFERGLPLHRAVTEAISSRDPGRAEELSRQLVRMPYEDLTERLGEDSASGLP